MKFLHRILLIAVIVLSMSSVVSLPPMVPIRAQSCLPWSSPSTWPELGHVPTSTDNPVIPVGRTVCLDTVDAVAGTLTVDGALTKTIGGQVQLTMSGNLVVQNSGLMSLVSASPSDAWFVQFLVPSESQFVGGGNVCPGPASDIGLWVCGSGRLTLQGAAKTSWTRLTGSVAAGDTTITVLDATGWAVGDALAVVPTEPTTVASNESRYDIVTVSSLNGNIVTFSPALLYPHPSTTIMVARRDGSVTQTTYTAEVLNLTRSARIEGRIGLRTHLFVSNSGAVAHTIRHVQFRWLGPLAGQASGIVGRYGGPHFHRCADNCSGTLLEGNVVRDFGNHAFVPHDSNGITLRANVAHEGFADPYWYDTVSGVDVGPNSTTYDGNVASKVNLIPGSSGARMSGFLMAHGHNGPYDATTNQAINNVAVGIRGGSQSSGYHWPEIPHGVWKHEFNLSHNNLVHGLFTWQNDNRDHRVFDFVAYHNRSIGLAHGAYVNCYIYDGISLHGNRTANLQNYVQTHSMCGPGRVMTYRNVYSDSAGRHAWAVRFTENSNSLLPALFENSTYVGYAGSNNAGFGMGVVGIPGTPVATVSGVTFGGNQFWLTNTVGVNTLIRYVDQDSCVKRYDQPGTFVPAWNARTQSPISTFCP